MANNPTNEVAPDAPFINEVICTGVYGKVKWFNVKRGYGVLCRNDNQEDVFINECSIVKPNLDHPIRSVGEGEEIQFDIVKGPKGNEAANVCGADGNNVKGSEYALRFMRSRGRGRGYRGRGGRGRAIYRWMSEEYDSVSTEDTLSERSFCGGGRRSMSQYKRSFQSNNIPFSPINNDYAPEIQICKEIISSGVFGKVEWFNAQRGYGFVTRNDNQEYVFVQQSAIVNSNPGHPRKSLEEGEEIKFDVVRGSKGNEAANVCGADGNHVKGNEEALRYMCIRNRGRGYGGGRGKSFKFGRVWSPFRGGRRSKSLQRPE